MRRKRRKRILTTVVSVLGIFILMGIIAAGLFVLLMMSPVAEAGETKKVEVARGAVAQDVAADLEEQGLIRNKMVFDLLCRFYKVDAQLKVGVYSISSGMSPKEIIEVLQAGPQVERVTVLIPEGYRVDQIIDRLVENGFGSSQEFYDAAEAITAANFPFLEEIPARSQETGNRLEGFLFPDGYVLDRDLTPKRVLEVMLSRFGEEVTEEVRGKLAARNMSIREWVIKASIVERETVLDEERPIVASVFENRLKIGMKLESCATVQYVLKENKPVLSYQDIRTESPYNTYQNTGLPIGPIACPGKKSLEAALNPADTKYLYFCAKPDRSQAFAETLQEHNRNVEKYVNS